MALRDRRQEDFFGENSMLSVANFEQRKRLALLLGHSSMPSRSSLLLALDSKDILQHAAPACQQLFALLQAEFTPLKLWCEGLGFRVCGGSGVYALAFGGSTGV